MNIKTQSWTKNKTNNNNKTSKRSPQFQLMEVANLRARTGVYGKSSLYRFLLSFLGFPGF